MAINISDVSLTLDDKVLFNHMNWNFPDKGVFLLSGPNGSGKTTLFNILTRSKTPSSGEITFLNHADDSFFVPHDVFMYEYLTGKEFLDLVMKTRNVSNQSDYAAKLAIDWELQDSMNSQIHNYSLGMKKKLILIASLISGAHTIYLDEALNGVDVSSVGKILNEIKQQGEQRLIILVSHQEEILRDKQIAKLQIKNASIQIEGA